MKIFAAVLALFAAIAYASATSSYGGSSSGGSSYGGSSYGGSSIPAPPCPKNYLFSCQPNLAPAPCAQPPPSYGSAGAYSQNIPTYVRAPMPYNGYQGFQGLTAYQGNGVQAY